MINLVYIFVGLGIGVVGAWLWLRGKSGKEIAVLKEKLNVGDSLKSELEQSKDELSVLRTQLAETRIAGEKDLVAAEEKLVLLTNAKELLSKEFENLANRIFEDKSSRLVGENRTKLEEILMPFKDQLGDFRKRVDAIYAKEGEQRASLLTKIEQLTDLNNKIDEDAKNLTMALKGQSKTRGNWGEMVLERVLEMSGLTRGREYESQLYLKEKHGGAQGRYPDFVVHLPEGRDVVIDSKMVLNDYNVYCSAEDDSVRAEALKAHVAAVKKHMMDLSSKNYQELEGINPLEQVIMCIPNEPAYITAVAEDSTLHDDAMKHHILIVGPNTLVLTLKIIAAMWRTEDQSRNALEIAERGQKLYDKFVGFVEDLEGVEKALSQASKMCGEAKGKLSEGGGNLVGQAKKLIALGVKAKKQLPQELAEKSDADS
ncbi:MAG: DNA recombination protein RmuC [Kiritimatiellae bacterium]|nr:DNA recombination protein RmuC [Kiritimatiellia bacterium]